MKNVWMIFFMVYTLYSLSVASAQTKDEIAEDVIKYALQSERFKNLQNVYQSYVCTTEAGYKYSYQKKTGWISKKAITKIIYKIRVSTEVFDGKPMTSLSLYREGKVKESGNSMSFYVCGISVSSSGGAPRMSCDTEISFGLTSFNFDLVTGIFTISSIAPSSSQSIKKHNFYYEFGKCTPF